MSVDQIIEADLTWVHGAFEPNVQVCVNADGTIGNVGAGKVKVTRRLEGRALLPGFVNAHSHAFQRGLRGRGERFGGGVGSFWTWRTAMYDLVDAMDEERLYALTCQAYREMLAAGITTVGEFHYLHHADGKDFAFDDVVLRAASDVGIRLVLLNAYYRTGGIDAPLSGGQLRFGSGGPGVYWAQMDGLAEKVDPRTQSLGAVVHSIRAAPPEDIQAIAGEADRRGLVLHMHVEEQPAEIHACIRRYGRTPMRLLLEHDVVGPRFTAVHCTHTVPRELEEFAAAEGIVCLCPLTEANLGDGLPPVDATGRVCLGSDSNARIDMIEEMRWMEYGQRLRTQRRGIWSDASGHVARTLMTSATRHGAEALGLNAGAIETGAEADFVTIDLEAEALAGWEAETLLESMVFGAGAGVVEETCVGGRWNGEG